MRLLFLGELDYGQTSLMRLRAFQRLGFTTRGIHTIEPWLETGWVPRQLQRRLQCGPTVNRINAMALEAAADFRPALVWAEKQECLRPDTIATLKRRGAKVIHFTPDPYFSVSWKRTRLMDAALPLFDALVFCKAYEAANYRAVGPQVVYMPLGYCDQVHRPLPSDDLRWRADVGFVGGWEPRRAQVLDAVAKTGVELKIWGSYWEFLREGRWTLRRSLILKQLARQERFSFEKWPRLAATFQGGEVYGDDYARALTGARIGIGLLRRAWPDQHTTRSFEIPACGSMLLADRTEEHRSLFEEGREADFFDTAEELIDRMHFYASHEAVRARVAEAGRQRSKKSRYAYVHRLADALTQLGIHAN